MKSFMFAILLSLLLLSFTAEVSSKTMSCYRLTPDAKEQSIDVCQADDPVCTTAVDKNTKKPTYKRCGNRDLEIFSCKNIAPYIKSECKEVCDTLLCNDE